MQFDSDKTRIIQELVPGKQITLAHIIANPDDILYKKLGLDPAEEHKGAIGILTVSPSETASRASALLFAPISIYIASVFGDFLPSSPWVK